MNRNTIITILVIMLLSVVLVACESNIFSLKVGDCFNGALADPGYTIEATNVELVSCDEPHESEVFASFELPDSIWKGQDYVYKQAVIGCKTRFETYVGIENELSTLAISLYYPMEEPWNEHNDRLVTCTLIDNKKASHWVIKR